MVQCQDKDLLSRNYCFVLMTTTSFTKRAGIFLRSFQQGWGLQKKLIHNEFYFYLVSEHVYTVTRLHRCCCFYSLDKTISFTEHWNHAYEFHYVSHVFDCQLLLAAVLSGDSFPFAQCSWRNKPSCSNILIRIFFSLSHQKDIKSAEFHFLEDNFWDTACPWPILLRQKLSIRGLSFIIVCCIISSNIPLVFSSTIL